MSNQKEEAKAADGQAHLYEGMGRANQCVVSIFKGRVPACPRP
jgi:hypothetical protein